MLIAARFYAKTTISLTLQLRCEAGVAVDTYDDASVATLARVNGEVLVSEILKYIKIVGCLLILGVGLGHDLGLGGVCSFC